MDENLKKLIITHAEYAGNAECCGFIALDNLSELKVIPCDNIHADKKRFFQINADDFLKYQRKFNIIATYHSHLQTTCEPSGYDKAISEEWALPFYVYSCKVGDFFLSFPTTYDPPDLLGRPYVDDLQNCFRFIVDYYNKFNALKFADFNYCLDRQKGKFGEKAAYTIKSFIRKNRLYEVGDLKKHDLLLFKSDLYGFSHFAIFVGEDEIIHHEEKKLSTGTVLTSNHAKNIFKIFRNPTFQ